VETAQNGIFTPLYLLLFFDITAHRPITPPLPTLGLRLSAWGWRWHRKRSGMSGAEPAQPKPSG